MKQSEYKYEYEDSSCLLLCCWNLTLKGFIKGCVFFLGILAVYRD